MEEATHKKKFKAFTIKDLILLGQTQKVKDRVYGLPINLEKAFSYIQI